ncbi:MAG TPA: Rieske (2Fe-2S) protein [Vicinamibacterales bacterium]|nr:Rieske (2Fe-2S) protein [Vicinamibacterales bacterium]
MTRNPTEGRRDVLNWLLGSWLAGVLASIVYPVARYLVPPDVAEAAPPSVVAGKAADFAPNSGRIIAFGTTAVMVLRTTAGELLAFSATCTHLTCTVQYRPDLEHIWCACHNGHYDLNGRNIEGPPPRPLDRFEVLVQDDDVVVRRA